MGLQLGAALAPPLIASLMLGFGWQRALFWTSLPALGLIIWWGFYARNTPAEHPVSSDAELAELDPRRQAVAEAAHYLAAHRRAVSAIATCCCSLFRTCA